MIRVAAFASPLIWFANQTIQFALTPLTCPWQSNAILWTATIAALLLEVGSGMAAWVAWSHRQTDPPMPAWLSMSAMVLSGSFFIVIVAQAIPSLLLRGCA